MGESERKGRLSRFKFFEAAYIDFSLSRMNGLFVLISMNVCVVDFVIILMMQMGGVFFCLLEQWRTTELFFSVSDPQSNGYSLTFLANVHVSVSLIFFSIFNWLS